MQTTNHIINPADSTQPLFKLACATLIAFAPVLVGGCKTPAGRNGLPDLCAPTVQRDPFQGDRCAPPKGVEIDSAGYVRPTWRVLSEPNAICCAEPCLGESMVQSGAYGSPSDMPRVDTQFFNTPAPPK